MVLAQLEDALTIVATLIIVGAGTAAWIQLRRNRINREEHTALGFLSQFLRDEHFFESLKRLMMLPNGWENDTFLREDRDNIRAAERVYSSLEMLGYFVYTRTVHMKHVRDLAANGILNTWEKLEGYMEQEREVRGPHAFEWYQWLIERLRACNYHKEPAHVTFKDWEC